jgi:hypothetical protein
MKQPDLRECPLCKSTNVRCYQVGWSTIHCKSCYLQLSRPLPLNELVVIWNTRVDDLVEIEAPDAKEC